MSGEQQQIDDSKFSLDTGYADPVEQYLILKSIETARLTKLSSRSTTSDNPKSSIGTITEAAPRKKKTVYFDMTTQGNVCELPSSSSVVSASIGSFKFRRPMYNVNYDCLDGNGISDDSDKCLDTAVSCPWEILKWGRKPSECKPVFSSEISNALTRKYDDMCDPNDADIDDDFKKFVQRVTDDDNESTKDLITRYVLHIIDEEHKKEYKIPVDAFKKVIDVKTDMFACSDIKVSQQLWTGWPATCTSDDLMLSQLGLSEEVLELSFRAAPLSVCSNQFTEEDSINKSMEIDMYSSEEEEEEEEEDDDDDDDDDDDEYSELVMGDDTEELITINSIDDSLVPQDFDNEAAASMQFAVSFQEKYGELHPDFFLGTFSEALNEAFHKSAENTKLLAVYLHHNRSVLTNVFCSQLLCTELVVQYLSEHFVMWGWDVTLERNKSHFFHILENCFAFETTNLVDSDTVCRLKNTKTDKYPVIVIISGVRGRTAIIPGNVDLDELLSRLIEVVEETDEEVAVEKNTSYRGTDSEISTAQCMNKSNFEITPVAGPSRLA